MAIKKIINGAAPKLTTQIKAPNLRKAVVGIKKDEQIIKPQEEVIKEVESVSANILTPIVDEPSILEPVFDIPFVESPIVESVETETKLAKEKRCAKIALCIGVGFLVLMILNKK